MALNCGSSCIKVIIYGLNLIFLLLSPFFIIISWILFGLLAGDDPEIQALASFSSVLGCLIVVVTFLACCGTVIESRCMLITYGIGLMVLIIFQIVIGSVILSEAEHIKENTKNDLRKTFDNQDDFYEQIKIHSYQITYSCCGPDGPEFYNKSIIPISCCRRLTENNDKEWCVIQDAYTKGCASEVAEHIWSIFETIAHAALYGIVIEILGFLLTIILVKAINRDIARG